MWIKSEILNKDAGQVTESFWPANQAFDNG